MVAFDYLFPITDVPPPYTAFPLKGRSRQSAAAPFSAVFRLAQSFDKQTFYIGDASQAASCRTMDLATRPAPSSVADAGPHQEP